MKLRSVLAAVLLVAIITPAHADNAYLVPCQDEKETWVIVVFPSNNSARFWEAGRLEMPRINGTYSLDNDGWVIHSATLTLTINNNTHTGSYLGVTTKTAGRLTCGGVKHFDT